MPYNRPAQNRPLIFAPQFSPDSKFPSYIFAPVLERTIPPRFKNAFRQKIIFAIEKKCVNNQPVLRKK